MVARDWHRWSLYFLQSPNFRLEAIEIGDNNQNDEKVLQFLEGVDPERVGLRELGLTDSGEISRKVWREIFRVFGKTLVALDLGKTLGAENCLFVLEELVSSGVALRLSRINLSGNQNLPDAFFFKLEQNFPSLQELQLSSIGQNVQVGQLLAQFSRLKRIDCSQTKLVPAHLISYF